MKPRALVLAILLTCLAAAWLFWSVVTPAVVGDPPSGGAELDIPVARPEELAKRIGAGPPGGPAEEDIARYSKAAPPRVAPTESRSTELRGVLRDPTGRPVVGMGYWVESRRDILGPPAEQARTGVDGSFVVRIERRPSELSDWTLWFLEQDGVQIGFDLSPGRFEKRDWSRLQTPQRGSLRVVGREFPRAAKWYAEIWPAKRPLNPDDDYQELRELELPWRTNPLTCDRLVLRARATSEQSGSSASFRVVRGASFGVEVRTTSFAVAPEMAFVTAPGRVLVRPLTAPPARKPYSPGRASGGASTSGATIQVRVLEPHGTPTARSGLVVNSGRRTALSRGAASIPAAAGGPVRLIVDDGEVFERNPDGAPTILEFRRGQGEAPLGVGCSGPFDAETDGVAAVILETAAGAHRSAIRWDEFAFAADTTAFVELPGAGGPVVALARAPRDLTRCWVVTRRGRVGMAATPLTPGVGWTGGLRPAKAIENRPDGVSSKGTLEFQIRVPGVPVFADWRTVDRFYVSRARWPDHAWFRRFVPQGGAFRYRFLAGSRVRVLSVGN